MYRYFFRRSKSNNLSSTITPFWPQIDNPISTTYNIKIIFKDISKKKISISGIIDLYPNNLKSVISSISLLADREFKLKGDTYIVL